MGERRWGDVVASCAQGLGEAALDLLTSIMRSYKESCHHYMVMAIHDLLLRGTGSSFALQLGLGKLGEGYGAPVDSYYQVSLGTCRLAFLPNMQYA